MASPLGYRIDCPKCGAPLATVALDTLTAPWLCAGCHRGFWSAELSDVARARYRPRHHDWGQGTPATAIRRSVQTEWGHAQGRGSSLRVDQLPMADTRALTNLLKRPGLHPDFVTLAQAELDRRSR